MPSSDAQPRLENRLPDETVNYDTEHPLKEFAWLVVGVLGAVAAGAALIGFFAGEIAARLPFGVEREFAAQISRHFDSKPETPAAADAALALRAIAAKLVPAMALPPDMTLTVHYADDGLVNAFATLGGNIVFHRGLIEKFDSEDAVAMVLAHEIAHAKLRHPAAHLGRGVAIGLALSVASTGMGQGLAGNALQTAGTLPLLKYGRDQERAADLEALRALAAVYGHLGGATDTFRAFAALREDEAARVEFLRTHPLTAARQAEVERAARDHGWVLDGPRRPLPAALASLRSPAS